MVAGRNEISKNQKNKDLKLAIINLMPNKQETQNQWLRLLSGSQYEISVDWFYDAMRKTKNCDEAYLKKYYQAIECLTVCDFDAILVTGAPVEKMRFEEVDYWGRLKRIFDEATEDKTPILGICWAAQAMLYHFYGIEKNGLEEKCFGIFEHQILENTLWRDLEEPLYLPQSRHTQWHEEALKAHPNLQALIESQESGIFAVRDDQNRWYFSGHLEYDLDTLVKEYQRDVEKGQAIHVPHGYERSQNGVLRTDKTWKKSAQGILEAWLTQVLQTVGERAIQCD